MPQPFPALTHRTLAPLIAAVGVLAVIDVCGGPPLLGPVQPAFEAFAMVAWFGTGRGARPAAGRRERHVLWAGLVCVALLAVTGVAELFV